MPSHNKSSSASKPNPNKVSNKIQKLKISTRSIPAAVVTVNRQKPPKYPAPTKGGYRIKHNEYVQVLQGHAALTTEINQNLNPGNVNLFPWLSTVAGAFDKYIIHNLEIQYLHEVGTTVGGLVGMYFDYDVSDPMPLTLSTFMNNFEAVSTQPYGDLRLSYRKSEENFKKYFVTTTPITTEKQALYYPAALRVISQGLSADLAAVGIIRIKYDIEFMEPSLTSSTTNTILHTLCAISRPPSSTAPLNTAYQTWYDWLVFSKTNPEAGIGYFSQQGLNSIAYVHTDGSAYNLPVVGSDGYFSCALPTNLIKKLTGWASETATYTGIAVPVNARARITQKDTMLYDTGFTSSYVNTMASSSAGSTSITRDAIEILSDDTTTYNIFNTIMQFFAGPLGAITIGGVAHAWFAMKRSFSSLHWTPQGSTATMLIEPQNDSPYFDALNNDGSIVLGKEKDFVELKRLMSNATAERMYTSKFKQLPCDNAAVGSMGSDSYVHDIRSGSLVGLQNPGSYRDH
jgi:hypothetical protein